VKAILENLNRSVGIIGSAVITNDGMVASSAMSGRHDEETLAAVGSSLVISAQRSLKAFPLAVANMMTVDGSRGKIIIVNGGNFFLLVIADGAIALDAGMLDIRGTIEKLQKAISLD
jgi:predicted regulator of Ras-like GTPase activity (Roadblock/LC7/MglB family)